MKVGANAFWECLMVGESAFVKSWVRVHTCQRTAQRGFTKAGKYAGQDIFSRLREREKCFYAERMRLDADAIKEFKAIWKEEFGEDLSDDEAQEHGLRVLHLFALLLRPGAHIDDSSSSGKGNNFDKMGKKSTMEEGPT
jgi:hypothetical protein